MKRVDKIAIVRNVGSSWFALGLNILVGLFLSPYILHHLGDEAFGLWVLIFPSPAITDSSIWEFAPPSFAMSPSMRPLPRTTN